MIWKFVFQLAKSDKRLFGLKILPKVELRGGGGAGIELSRKEIASRALLILRNKNLTQLTIYGQCVLW